MQARYEKQDFSRENSISLWRILLAVGLCRPHGKAHTGLRVSWSVILYLIRQSKPYRLSLEFGARKSHHDVNVEIQKSFGAFV